jgi:GH24 family phage-related lysozyme (muramidase)
MAQAFSGGNISEERLEEITLPSDTATSLLIKRFENFTPVANFDVRQNTNGFGTEATDANEEITLEEAQSRLMARVTRDADYIKNFGERYNYNFTDNEVAALNSFIFNLGRGALDQVTASGTRSKEEIASKMLEYNKAGGKQLSGLVKRRKDERDVFIGEAILGGGD